jgi:O-methyltransferase involved in polyketide biosynthesis
MSDNLERAERADRWLSSVVRWISGAAEHVGLGDWMNDDYPVLRQSRERAGRMQVAAVKRRDRAIDALVAAGSSREDVLDHLKDRRFRADLARRASRPLARTGRAA